LPHCQYLINTDRIILIPFYFYDKHFQQFILVFLSIEKSILSVIPHESIRINSVVECSCAGNADIRIGFARKSAAHTHLQWLTLSIPRFVQYLHIADVVRVTIVHDPLEQFNTRLNSGIRRRRLRWCDECISVCFVCGCMTVCVCGISVFFLCGRASMV
jgi:hypothetical protein